MRRRRQHMNLVLEAYRDRSILYLDDIVIYSCSLQEHFYPDFTKPLSSPPMHRGTIGGMSQEQGKDLPIAYTSRLLNTAEQNYSTIEKELLAIVYSVNYFRPYVYGHQREGARKLKETNKLPEIKDGTLGRAKVTKIGGKYLIALVIKDRVSAITQVETIKEATFAVRQLLFPNQITEPADSDKARIIAENHSTAIGGHKGVTKTYNRIKYKYFASPEEETYRNSSGTVETVNLKETGTSKTRQPMILRHPW
ncbi:uncharacterized protein LOC113563473 [Ooceraea biroi]|uniref:uncharacterized protein LOC113563473 n=1 Tax=Ooceraea biroi TaxID=2015173 RepID=UPI000F07E012|nr:uncharacterized protein LOC113563473 [Ooceraea biroi]